MLNILFTYYAIYEWIVIFLIVFKPNPNAYIYISFLFKKTTLIINYEFFDNYLCL